MRAAVVEGHDEDISNVIKHWCRLLVTATLHMMQDAEGAPTSPVVGTSFVSDACVWNVWTMATMHISSPRLGKGVERASLRIDSD